MKVAGRTTPARLAGLLVVAAVAAVALAQGKQPKPRPAVPPSIKKQLFAGRVVLLRDALKRRKVKSSSEFDKQVVLETADGQLYMVKRYVKASGGCSAPIGRDLDAGHPLARFMEPNIWPAEVPEFEPTMRELFLALEASGRRVLSAIAIHLGEDRHFFDSTIEDGNSVLRLLRYPPLPDDAPDGAIRAAAHGDINAITMLLGAEEAGLELLTKKGEWLPVSPPPGALAVNIGDMLERLTNGRLRSTTHRVVNPAGDAVRRARYSMPFFLHFRPDYLIDPLPSCIAEGEEENAPEPILAHDFLMQRLREIKLV